MSIDVKKLKIQISKLKELLDTDEVGLDKLVLFLLSAELSLRGVVLRITFDTEFSSTLSVPFILDEIQTSAGKVIVDESCGVPKAVIIGAAAIAALAAEKCVQSILFAWPSTISGDKNGKNIVELCSEHFHTDHSSISAVIERCSDVKDNRFHSILSLMLAPNVNTIEELAALLMRIASGNALRAATLSGPDVPVMWKRALDLILITNELLSRICSRKGTFHRNTIETRRKVYDWNQLHLEHFKSYHTSDASYPLSKLIAIAETRGNERRASEFRLHLVESFLSSLNTDEKVLVTDTARVEWNNITTSFFDKEEEDIKNRCVASSQKLNCLINSRNTLLRFLEARSGDEDSNHQLLLHKLLKLRVDIAYEDYIVSCISEARFIASKNRIDTPASILGGSGGIPKIPSLKTDMNTSTFVSSAKVDLLGAKLRKDEVIAEVWADYDINSIDSSALSLIDFVINDVTFFVSDSEMQREMCNTLCIYVDRLTLRAKTLMKMQRISSDEKMMASWGYVVHSLLPISQYLSTHCMQILSMEQNHLIETVTKALLTALWMNMDSFDLDSRTMVQDIQTLLKKSQGYRHRIIEEEKRLEEEIEGVKKIVSSTDVTDAEIDTEFALMACQGHIILSTIGQEGFSPADFASHIEEETKKLVATVQKTRTKSSSHAVAKYGSTFLQLLVCWSGLHRSPWPFCTIAQARDIIRSVKGHVSVAESEWGRVLSTFETIIIRLAEADAENGLLPGGLTHTAHKLYNEVLVLLKEIKLVRPEEDQFFKIISLFQSHALSGLARVCVGYMTEGESGLDHYITAENKARSSLSILLAISAPTSVSRFYVWMDELSFDASLRLHICTVRQLLADILIQLQRPFDAQELLLAAVKESPHNYEATFALAAFYLHMSYYEECSTFGGDDGKKKAQMLLLKCVKIDGSQPDPFALLGLFYEIQNDDIRATGCYSKALIADPCHPIAGRGILRLKGYEDVKRLCETAIKFSSPENGWAWAAIGRAKYLQEQNDSEAILYFQQALRCKDIESRNKESLGLFFQPPHLVNSTIPVNEASLIWSSLAACYRRLGKYSASLRAYNTASELGTSAEILCELAQVQLDLGMVTDAERTFRTAFSFQADNCAQYMCAYGLGRCMMALAQAASEEGKFGVALRHLQEGIHCLKRIVRLDNDNLSFETVCALKLLGNIYNFGVTLPDSVFAPSVAESCTQESNRLRFVSEGEKVYHRAFLLLQESDNVGESDVNALTVDILCDLGTNILFQVRVVYEGIDDIGRVVELGDESSHMRQLLRKSIDFFSTAIDASEFDNARAWNGIGYALSFMDPVMAQHAFCRSLQIDKVFSDSWANIGFLYMQNGKFVESHKIFETLTQITDSPVLWIGKGLLLEQESSENPGQQSALIKRTADAYRLALQVSRHPVAYLGLSLNTSHGPESFANLHMYLESGDSNDSITQKIIDALVSSERGIHLMIMNHDYNVGRRMALAGLEELRLVKNKLDFYLGCENDSKELPVRESLHPAKMEYLANLRTSTKSLMDAVSKTLNNDDFRSSLLCDRPNFFSAQQNILLHPCDGGKWLDLTKKIVEKVTRNERPKRNSLAAAFATMHRAKYLIKYNRRIMRGRHEDVTPQDTSASLLAEALSLSTWLEEVEDSGCITKNHGPWYDVQRSLILDPENQLARSWLLTQARYREL